jgi:putative ABC transport system permease protein
VALWPLGAKLFDGDMPLSWWVLLPWLLILPMLAIQWLKPRRHSAPLARLMS